MNESTKRRGTRLTTLELHRLDMACEMLTKAFGTCTYLVGSEERDVDIRTILSDEDFDRLFAHRPLWELTCFSIGAWLGQMSGLPIDYQIQRQTQANAKYGERPRNPVGMGRIYAGGGDATQFTKGSTNAE